MEDDQFSYGQPSDWAQPVPVQPPHPAVPDNGDPWIYQHKSDSYPEDPYGSENPGVFTNDPQKPW